MDNLTIALCICIGTGVPWLVAIQSETGARQLIWNSVFGLIGTALSALAFEAISPTYSIIALIAVGPLVALLAIAAGQAARRAIMSRRA